MTTEGTQVAWIIGAGFSRPLGGPLLGRLLSLGSFRDLAKLYPQQLTSNASQWACHIYQYGRSFSQGTLIRTNVKDLPGENLWEDAEEFLDLLDAAAETQATAQNTINRIVELMRIQDQKDQWNVLPIDGTKIYEMRAAARKLIAAECSNFVTHAQLGRDHDDSIVPERWSPHVGWLKKLNDRDTLVTFNYDCAIEKMRAHLQSKKQPTDGPAVVLPSVPGTSSNDPQAKKPASESVDGRARLLKLHGSTDWSLSREMGIQRERPEWFLTARDDQMVIGTPGPTKTKITELLEPLWKSAEQAIQDAQAIVFVGYRFPPTDATALKRILGAMGANKDTVNLRLHVVLGPDLAHRDVVRLRGLLDATAQRAGRRSLEHFRAERGLTAQPGPDHRIYEITIHPMWSQDFFSLNTHETVL